MKLRTRVQGSVDASGLLLSNVAPVSAVFAIRSFGGNWWVFWVAVGFVLLGFAGFFYFRYRHFDSNNVSEPVISQVQSLGAETSAYLASFILPLVSVNNPSLQDILAYSFCLIVYSSIALRSNLLLANPIFYLFGYKLWRIRSPDFSGDAILMGKDEPALGHSYLVVGRDNILMQKQ